MQGLSRTPRRSIYCYSIWTHATFIQGFKLLSSVYAFCWMLVTEWYLITIKHLDDMFATLLLPSIYREFLPQYALAA